MKIEIVDIKISLTFEFTYFHKMLKHVLANSQHIFFIKKTESLTGMLRPTIIP